MLEILKANDENFNGSYKINTADAYRGAPVYISGKSGRDWYVNLPATSAQAKLFAGIVNQYPMIQTGSDTADATDKLVKGSRVVVLTGECEIKVNGGCVHQPTWSKYWFETMSLVFNSAEAFRTGCSVSVRSRRPFVRAIIFFLSTSLNI